MKTFLLFVFSFSLAAIPAFAQSVRSGKALTTFAGFGIGKNFSTIGVSGHNSTFQGWTPEVEAGLEVPLGGKSGLFLSAQGKMLDFKNSSDDARFIEHADGTSHGAKLGIFVGSFTFGGGLSNEKLSIRQASKQTGNSLTTISGQTRLFFANYILNIQSDYRLTFELEYRAGKLGSYQYSDASATMKFSFLFGL